MEAPSTLGAMEMLPLAFVSGWACGINAWATALVLGLLGRFAAFAEVPDFLQRTDVLIVVALLALVELVVDKISVVNSVWDVLATVVRPIAGGVIGALLGGADGSVSTIVLAAVGGVTALLSHLVHASLRLAVNTTADSAGNIAASVGSDLAVAFAVVVAVLHPVVVAIVVLVVLVLAVLLALKVRTHTITAWRAFRRLLTGRVTGIRQRLPSLRRARGRDRGDS